MTNPTPDETEGHTPTPWRVTLTDETAIIGPEREYVANTWHGVSDYPDNCTRRAADAALIVRAVNEYVALKAENERLRAALEPFAEAHYLGDNYVKFARTLIEQARAALSKAEGEE